MKFNLSALFLGSTMLLSASQASASEWNIESGDERLSAEALEEMLVGRTLDYGGGTRSVFLDDERYEFHVGGNVYEYDYRFTEEGAVCITSPERSRCDLIVQNDGAIISINEQGQRYPAEIR